MSSDLGKKILNSSVSERQAVSAFGQDFFIRELSEGERHWYSVETKKALAKGEPCIANACAQLVRMTACDEGWQPLFSEADMPALSNLPARQMDRLAEVALKLSGLSEATKEDSVPPLSETN